MNQTTCARLEDPVECDSIPDDDRTKVNSSSLEPGLAHCATVGGETGISPTLETSFEPQKMNEQLQLISQWAESRENNPKTVPGDQPDVLVIKQAILSLPDRFTLKPDLLAYISGIYQAEFDRLKQLEDIDMAIDCIRQAVVLTPDGHPERIARLNGLGYSHSCRFERLRDLADIDAAIDFYGQAALLIPEGDLDRPARLNNLGVSYESRFKRQGDPADIDAAIECNRQAVMLTPDEHTDKPIWLNNLGNSYGSRFGISGDLADIDAAINFNRQAILLALEGHPDRPAWLSNLGGSHERRFEKLGDLADLNSAIDCLRQAVLLTPNEHPYRSVLLNNLGTSLENRFRRLGSLADIDAAIDYVRQAVLLTPDEHPEKPGWLNNLGSSHNSRYERLGDLADIDTAFDCNQQAVLVTPEGHPDKPSRLNSLGVSHQHRFERLGDIADIDAAIACNRRALLLTPDGHPDKPSWLGNLGSWYDSRFRLLSEPTDIDRGVECSRQAVLLTPEGHPNKPAQLNNLGNLHESRFKQLGDPADIDIAIECKRQAVSLTPDEDPGKAGQLNGLGKLHVLRSTRLGVHTDISQAIRYIITAAQSSTGHPSHRLQASRTWADLSSFVQSSSPLDAYRQAMSLLPQVVWLGAAVNRRYELIKCIGNLPVDAASAAIASQAHDLALEWLEQGRSIVWNQILLPRTPLHDLRLSHASLADQLQQVATELDQAGSMQSAYVNSSISAPSLEQTSQRHRFLALEWERLLEEVRQIPDCSSFMKPQTMEKLAQAAHSSTIVVVNAQQKRCDALILPPGSTSTMHVPLPSLSYESCIEMRAQMMSWLQRNDVRIRDTRHPVFFHETDAKVGFEDILATLWTDVAKPILDALGYLDLPSEAELPRVTWCTTGPLAFLPLHAAGLYNEPHARTFNHVVSSYMPNLSALINRHAPSSTFNGILAVGQAALGSRTQLPGTIAELDHIEAQARDLPLTRLDEDQATPEAVLSAMQQHPWVHLACHASQNASNPTATAFQLHHGQLDLATITRQPLKHAELAFLSACQTATGDEALPDEAIHLAAGMLMAGYRTVIATMWSIKDEDAPVVAKHFYSKVLEEGVADSSRAARALHDAIGHLRAEVGEKNFERWVPYIHLGQ